MMNNKFLYVITGLWIIFFIVIYGLGLFERPSSFNELGDFLAGVFAPVGFVWLIFGYIQQGKQLDQNTKALEQQEMALKLQIDEIKETVKQQNEMLIINKNNLNALYERERPAITYENPGAYKYGDNVYGLYLNLYNEGKGDCYNIIVELSNQQSPKFARDFIKVRGKQLVTLMTLNAYVEIKFEEVIFEHWTGEFITLDIKISYESVYAEKFEEIFKIIFPLYKDQMSLNQSYDFNNTKI